MRQANQKIRFKTQYLFLLFVASLGLSVSVHAFSVGTDIEGLSQGRVTVLNGQWELNTETKTGNPEYSCRIPEDAGDSLMLCMKTYIPEFQLLVDGTPVYSFSDVYVTQGRSQHMIRLPQNSQGKQISIQLKQGNAIDTIKENRLGDSYLGEEHEVAIKLLRDNWYALLFTVFSFLIGAGALIIGCWLIKGISKEMRHCLMCFGIFVLITGVWVLTDSELLLFVTGKVEAVSLISFISFMIMPVFLLLFLQYILGENRVFSILCWLFVIAASAYMASYLIPAFPGYLLLIPTHLLCVFSVIFVLRLGRKKLKIGKNEKVKWVMEGFGLLSVCVFLALVLFYINPTSPYSNMYCLGMSVFILCLMRAMLSGLYGQVEEKANMAAYKRLAYMDAMTGLENRAAFMEAQNRAEDIADLSCIMFDVNNLKQINDAYGHEGGDRVIITAAHTSRDAFGEIGTCFRIGGDEFVVLLTEKSEKQVRAALESLKESLAEKKRSGFVSVDIAAGYAVRHGAETVDQMVQRADALMYEEKRRMKTEGS